MIFLYFFSYSQQAVRLLRNLRATTTITTTTTASTEAANQKKESDLILKKGVQFILVYLWRLNGCYGTQWGIIQEPLSLCASVDNYPNTTLDLVGDGGGDGGVYGRCFFFLTGYKLFFSCGLVVMVSVLVRLWLLKATQHQNKFVVIQSIESH